MNKVNSQDLKWQEIKFYIELKIIKGELKSGDKLPSVREAAGEYNITKETAAKVYIKLEEEGVIMKRADTTRYYVKPFTATSLKNKHITNLKNEVEEIINKAKNINANYEEIKPMRDLLEAYLNSLGSLK